MLVSVSYISPYTRDGNGTDSFIVVAIKPQPFSEDMYQSTVGAVDTALPRKNTAREPALLFSTRTRVGASVGGEMNKKQQKSLQQDCYHSDHETDDCGGSEMMENARLYTETQPRLNDRGVCA